MKTSSLFFRSLFSGAMVLGGLLILQEVNAASADPVINNQSAQISNCTIPAGSTTCTATIIVKAPSGMTYSLMNHTRGVSSPNIITPNNYQAYSGGFAYILSYTSLQDAANRLTHGDNDITITPPGTNVATFKVVGKGVCAPGSTWTGKLCLAAIPPTEKIGDCILSSNSFLETFDNGTYIFSSLNSSHVTLGSLTRNSCILACDSSMINFIDRRMNCFWDGIIVKEYVGLTPNPLPTIRGTNCTIRKGARTCISTVTMTPAPLKYYSLSNTTRGTTLSVAFRPGVATISGSSIGEQAPNYLTNGTNTLVLKDGSTTVSTIVTSGSCETGSTWNGQICAENPPPPTPLSIMCMKPSFAVGEEASCKIYGGVGNLTCWQKNGNTSTNPVDCKNIGWDLDGSIYYYYKTVTTSMVGNYILYVKDSAGTIASTNVEYTNPGVFNPYASMRTGNCTIQAGKSTCASTISVTSTRYKGTTGGRVFDLKNFTRNITSANLFSPGNTTLDPDGYPVYTVSTSQSGDAANYLTKGVNDLALVEGGVDILKGVALATCVNGTTWDGSKCVATTPPPIACTMEVRYCPDQSIMPRNQNTCEWLPGQCKPIVACSMAARMCENGDPMPFDSTTCEWLPHECDLPIPVTSLRLTDYIINTTTLDYTGGTISLNSNNLLSLKGISRPGATIYFYREGQSSYDSTNTSSGGEWLFPNAWGPDGAKIIIPGEYTYILSGRAPNAPSGNFSYSPQVAIRINVTRGNAAQVSFEARNCTIPVGGSTCPSTVTVTSTRFIGTSGGRIFDMKNTTRNITSVGLFNPGSTTLNTAGYPVYTVTTHSSGDAANYAKFGTNAFELIEGGVVIARTTMNAICNSGTTWNGQTCAVVNVPNPRPGNTGGILPTNTLTAKMTSCTIPEGSGSCASTLFIFAQSGKTFEVRNITRNILSNQNVNPNNYTLASGKGVYITRGNGEFYGAQMLTSGVNYLSIKDISASGKTIRVRAIARCISPTIWDGTKCARVMRSFPLPEPDPLPYPYPVTPTPTAFRIEKFITTQGTVFSSNNNLNFNPTLDKTLTIEGIGPVGTVEVIDSSNSSVITKTTTLDSTGKWRATISPSILINKGVTSLTIWDGQNTGTKVQTQITNTLYSNDVINPSTTGVLTTVLVDLN